MRGALAAAGIALAAMVLALLVTPPVSVSAFGQTVEVGAVKPSFVLGISGPGQADLFGEGTIETVQHFNGPIRPLIVWQRFNRNDEASQFIQSSSSGGRRVVQTGSAQVGDALASGWTSYFRQLLVIAGLLGGALYLLGVGVLALRHGHGHTPQSRRHYATMLAGSVVASVAVTAAFVALTAVSAANQLGAVRSLSDLTGTAKVAQVPLVAGPARTNIDAVVIGDSTAAGIGNAPLPNPTPQDTACRRSADAYAEVLQSSSRFRVLNLACSSATIADGLLGRQTTGSAVLPAQVGVLQSIVSNSVVLVSIGANDVGWSDFMRYCYGLPRCDDQASQRLFESRLDTFRLQYAQLLQQLSALPQHPKVIVTGYYDPFGDSFGCPALRDPHAPTVLSPGYGFGADPGQDNQKQKITEKIEPLRSHLALLNDILTKGAAAFGYVTVVPSFAGHALCGDQAWVQGLSERYPFHPNAAGELAIAAVQLPQIAALVRTTG